MRHIPIELEPDIGIRAKRMIEAEKELCRLAGVFHPDDLPHDFGCKAGNERRRRAIPVAYNRRVIWPTGRRFARGEIDGAFCWVDDRVSTQFHNETKCADQALGSSACELGIGTTNLGEAA